MRTAVRPVLAAALAVLLTTAGAAQSVSQKKDIAVFNLGYYRWTIPPSALGAIDEQIRSVFVNLGRFTVIGMPYRLGEEDVLAFIDAIKRYREESLEIPEAVQAGQEFFTTEDFNRLVGGFIVVIPAVADFQKDLGRDGRWQVSVRTSFTFIDVERIATVAQFFVDTSGVDRDADRAVRDAVDAVAPRLVFEVRKLDAFRLSTGILEVHGSEVLLELGRNLGVRPGDEYLALGHRVLASGREVTVEKGVLVVTSVDEEVSWARVLYADGELEAGDQLRELARFGMETAVHARLVALPAEGAGYPFLLGLRQTLSRGFGAVRPFLELDVPLNLLGSPFSSGLPLTATVGVEYLLRLGRLAAGPFIAAGVGLDVHFARDAYPDLTHIGGVAGLEASWLLGRDLLAAAEAGVMGWWSGTRPWASFSGAYAGVGIAVKF